MAKSLLGPISEKSLYRLHLWGGGKLASGNGGGVDEYIGRTAHVRSHEIGQDFLSYLCIRAPSLV